MEYPWSYLNDTRDTYPSSLHRASCVRNYPATSDSTLHINFFYVLLTVHLSISLDNDQLDAHLLYFTIRPLQSSTCFEHYMLIIRRSNCIDAASGIVISVSGRPVHRLRENWLNQFSLNLCTGRPLTERTIPDAASIQFRPPDDEHVMLETCRGL